MRDNPHNLPPSVRLLLGQHQYPGVEMSTLTRLLYAGRLRVDTSPEAMRRCIHALDQAEYERMGRIRVRFLFPELEVE